MPTAIIAPFGTWQSSITADFIASDSIGLEMVTADGGNIYWIETRPGEGGRCLIVRRSPDGTINDMTSADFSVGSRVHEYGGGAYAVKDSAIYFCNLSDQRIYQQRGNDWPVALTPAPSVPSGLRFADLLIDSVRQRLIAVCEDHQAGADEPINKIVAVPLDGSGSLTTIFSGRDFYSSPKLSYDKTKLAWLSWDHPNMPWDGTELQVAAIEDDGSLANVKVIAGGAKESVFQPEWTPSGELLFVSDRSDWWNLYSHKQGRIEPVCLMAAEFGRPQWQFGMKTYTIDSSNGVICAFNNGSIWKLARFDLENKSFSEIETGYTDIWWPTIANNKLTFRGASPLKLPAIISLDLDSGRCEELRASSSVKIEKNAISAPQILAFPTANGLTAHAFYYPPASPRFVGKHNEKPPLLVKSHGGPTGSLSSALNLEVQFWTSRGFALVDVNYGGSTGYGRRYRERLNGQWGLVDVDDCTNATKFLTEKGFVDPQRLLISGRSASGFTALCALTFKDVFRAGTSYYGISDLIALAADTHKFELHILDRLVGAYPEQRELYLARSPAYQAERIKCPVLFFQGLEDKVVPPYQTERMVDALQKNHVPVACVFFEGERHGFRRAETIKRALEGELYFYSQILGVNPADRVAPLPIENFHPPSASKQSQ